MNTLAEEIINIAIDEVNEDATDGGTINKDHSTTLLGPDSNIDSLSLVRLLVTVERLIEEKTEKIIVIVDESAFEAEQSPFVTVGSLTRHIDSLIAG
jgi:acyl carrier protein